MTAVEFLVQKKILISTDLDTRFNISLTRDCHIHSTKDLIKAIEEYAEMRVNEALKEQFYNDNP